jgi:hypothetical protein
MVPHERTDARTKPRKKDKIPDVLPVPLKDLVISINPPSVSRE